MNDKRKRALVLILSIVLLFSILTLIRQYKLWRINRSNCYTIGEIYEIAKNSRSAPTLKFLYYVDSIRYMNTRSYKEYNQKLIGRKFYIKYEKNNPKNSILLFKNESDYPKIKSIIESKEK